MYLHPLLKHTQCVELEPQHQLYLKENFPAYSRCVSNLVILFPIKFYQCLLDIQFA